METLCSLCEVVGFAFPDFCELESLALFGLLAPIAYQGLENTISVDLNSLFCSKTACMCVHLKSLTSSKITHIYHMLHALNLPSAIASPGTEEGCENCKL